MRKQTFVVTLEALPPLDRYFPRLEAEQMASILRDGVESKSCSFIGEVPFKVCVERADEVASASGKVREYSPQEFEETEESQKHLSGTLAR